MPRRRGRKKQVRRVVRRKKTTRKSPIKDKKISRGPDGLSLALFLISFILVVFGSWYHRISWLLLGFIPFLVAIWYEYMKHHL